MNPSHAFNDAAPAVVALPAIAILSALGTATIMANLSNSACAPTSPAPTLILSAQLRQDVPLLVTNISGSYSPDCKSVLFLAALLPGSYQALVLIDGRAASMVGNHVSLFSMLDGAQGHLLTRMHDDESDGGTPCMHAAQIVEVKKGQPTFSMGSGTVRHYCSEWMGRMGGVSWGLCSAKGTRHPLSNFSPWPDPRP